MQQQELINHYNEHYVYKNMDAETAKARVNELFPMVKQNNQQAFEEVLYIIREKVYWMVCRKMSFTSFGTIENVDDAIQHASLEYAKKSMTNFDNFKHDNFYAYSLDFFNRWTENYISRYYNKICLETELDISVDLKDNTYNDKTNAENPEQKLLNTEKKEYENEFIRHFIQTLEASLIEPHKLITYCYECLLPAILKDNHGIRKLLDWINKLNIPGKAKTSWANLETGEIGGLITRKSTYLLKWAINAMYKKKVKYLAEEFTDIYNICPLAKMPFQWGDGFQNALVMPGNSDGHSISQIGEVVITDKFEESSLHNWASRVGKTLKIETVCKMANNPDLANFAVEYAEQVVSKRKCKNVWKF